MKEAHRANTRSLLLSALVLSSSAFQAQAYYHPDEGRWISRDPMESKGRNAYAFISNNPVNVASHGLPGVAPGAKRENRVRPANTPNGTATCNQNTGNVDVQINRETCAGNCVESHEQVHVGQQSSCCQALAAACRANPSQCNAYIKLYNDWMSANDHTMECLALTDTTTCYWWRALTPQLKQDDCKCYREMEAELLGLALRKQYHCSKGGIPMTPCPTF